MKIIALLLAFTFIFCAPPAKENVYIASTPADRAIRNFLGISLTDSIDFIRWKLVINSGNYNLDCQYGLSKPNTNGFIDEKKVQFSGTVKKEGNYYSLQQKDKTLSLLEINPNILYPVDENKNMLIGNGGFSYPLNIINPIKTDQFNIQAKPGKVNRSIAYEGRTPCQELSKILELNKRSICNKLKWYFIFYTDSITGQPSHYLTAGTAYREETMTKGKWEIAEGKNGRIIYKLHFEKQAYTIHLLKADENVLLFTDAEGNLLVGNEDFGYALNRRYHEYPRK